MGTKEVQRLSTRIRYHTYIPDIGTHTRNVGHNNKEMRFALLVLYAAGTLAAPVLDERYPKADIKIVECSGSRFRPGATFEYEYSGETVHRVEGTTEKETGLILNAKVLITHLEGCAFHMRLTN